MNSKERKLSHVTKNNIVLFFAFILVGCSTPQQEYEQIVNNMKMKEVAATKEQKDNNDKMIGGGVYTCRLYNSGYDMLPTRAFVKVVDNINKVYVYYEGKVAFASPELTIDHSNDARFGKGVYGVMSYEMAAGYGSYDKKFSYEVDFKSKETELSLYRVVNGVVYPIEMPVMMYKIQLTDCIKYKDS